MLLPRDYKVAGSYPRKPQGPDSSASHTRRPTEVCNHQDHARSQGVTGTISYPLAAAQPPDQAHGHQQNQLDKTRPTPPLLAAGSHNQPQGAKERTRDAIRTVHPKPSQGLTTTTETPQGRQERRHRPQIALLPISQPTAFTSTKNQRSNPTNQTQHTTPLVQRSASGLQGEVARMAPRCIATSHRITGMRAVRAGQGRPPDGSPIRHARG